MIDVTLVWDGDLLFEKLFVEHGLSYQRVPSSALGTRFLPTSRVLIIPTGFANRQYTKIAGGIEANKRFFDRFVEEGGVLVVYGALNPEYTYRWLPFTLKYREQYGAVDIEVVQEHGCACIFEGDRAECDGYFIETDGDIILTGDGSPVLVAKEHGNGMIIATTIHEFPSGAFLRWAVAHRQQK
ncbi:MAG TPA: hypothetical protein EYP67_05310 [Methanosarcinales archaeon]|nr:hypothetical protein [Methanosarcinales archaeon]